MKRALIVVTSIFIALSVAGSAIAVEFDVTGSLRFQGIYNDKASSMDSNKADSFRDMRLRIRPEIKINDKISLIMRFDALEKDLSSNDSAFASNSDAENIDFDRAYLRIVSPIGLFMLGRQEGITWGTSFGDDEADTDRIKYVLPIPMGDNKLYVAAVMEKVTEVDKGVGASDKDNDKYYLSGTYVADNYRTGFLVGFYRFNTFQDPQQKQWADGLTALGGSAAVTEYGRIATAAGTAAATAAALAAAGDAAGAAAATDQYQTYAAMLAADTAGAAAFAQYSAIPNQGATTVGKVWLVSPYFTGKFGNLGISTELDYVTGKSEYADDQYDRDVSAYSFMFETTYDFGAATLQIGMATSSGDADNTDDDIECMGYLSPGVDWAKMFILTNDSHGMNNTLGNGTGNLVGDGFATDSTAMLDGYMMYYLGVDYKINDTMDIGTVMCMSKADDTPTGVDDDHGMEVDATFTWKLMDNLEYTGIIAYLSAGDYWQDRGAIADSEFKDTLAFYHKVEMTF